MHTKASAAVANNESDPLEMAAYIWMMKSQMLTVKDAWTASLILGASRTSSSDVARLLSSAPRRSFLLLTITFESYYSSDAST